MDKVKKIIAEKTVTLELIKAYLENNRPFFAYVVIRKLELEMLKGNEGIMEWPKNSIVLYSDYGHDVPDGVEEYVLQEYQKLLKDNDVTATNLEVDTDLNLGINEE